jgi:hypothetical protein
MRLIDADELKVLHNGSFEYVAKCDIDNAPTVDAKPIIRARWIEKNHILQCSNCGMEHRGGVVNFPADFCSYCGAEMQSEQAEELRKRIDDLQKMYMRR